MDALAQAKQVLCNITPLKTDCGALCGHACCRGTAEDGMILLPEESAFYKNCSWCRILEHAQGELLVCDGTCPRNERPFACMIFPLRIEVLENRARVIVDPLAGSVCPLADRGLSAFDRDFVNAAKAAASILLKEKTYRAFFREQTRIVREGLNAPLFTI